MGWKDWPYWLKGAITTFGIFIVLFGILNLAGWIIGEKCVPIGDVCYDKYIPFLLPFYKIFRSLDIIYYVITPFLDCVDNEWVGCEFVHVVTIWPSFILIAIIIGLIYGKIRTRKNM